MRELEQYLKVGRVRTAHGVHGAFKIELFSDDVERLAYLQTARLVNPKDENDYREVRLSLQGRRPESLILAALDINSREEIMTYQNWYVSVVREQAKVLKTDEYFVCDLLHCRVVDDFYGHLGEIKEILQNTQQDIFVIAKSGEKDLLLPRVKDFVRSIDIANGLILTKLPAGLYEIYRSVEK